MASEPDAIIVGAGLAGLACAWHLQEHGFSFQILEATDAVGGRIRTDHVDGFLLDRGAQAFLTASPEARRLLDYRRLGLHSFYPGALIYHGGRFRRIADPWRRPLEGVRNVLSGVGTLPDFIRLAHLRRRVLSGSLEHLARRPDSTTQRELQALGFSSAMVEQFFRPFLGSMFGETELSTSSRLFHWICRMLAEGEACLPEQGLEAIAQQIAAALSPATIRYGSRVQHVEPDLAVLEGGEELSARAVVVAVDITEAARLLDEVAPVPLRTVTTVYFAADGAPVDEPILMLNGTGEGPVNHVTMPSQVSPTYAPPGAALIAAGIVGAPAPDEERLVAAIRDQLQCWFGPAVRQWRLLRTYAMAGLPVQTPPALDPFERPVTLRPGLYVCGDHRDHASIQGALASGHRAAEAVIADLR